MWNILIAGLVAGGAYLFLKDDDKKESKQTPTKKNNSQKKVFTKRSKSDEDYLTLLYEIGKSDFNYALTSYGNYPNIKDEKFQSLRKAYVKNANQLENYIVSKDPIDVKYDESTKVILEKEGMDYGFLDEKPYHNWKDVKDSKFQLLLKEARKSQKDLLAFLKSKFKIKDTSDSELDKAIKTLEDK
jgi:hypothetical protein